MGVTQSGPIPGGTICSITLRPQWLLQCYWDISVHCVINQCRREPRVLGPHNFFFHNRNRQGCSTQPPFTTQWCTKIQTRDRSPNIWGGAGSQDTGKWDSSKAPEETSLWIDNKTHPFICISTALWNNPKAVLLEPCTHVLTPKKNCTSS